MRILFTGASSFTGTWFVDALTRQGHEVTAVFRRPLESYAGVRLNRVERVTRQARCVHGTAFGDASFLELIADGGPWDVLCHHGAEVTDYKSPDFDVHAAVDSNTHGLHDVLTALKHTGCRHVLLTGSVFESGEGAGSAGLPAFSPYGISKTLTHHAFQLGTSEHGLHLGKFVIANPFGPLEEPRFTSYLARRWMNDEIAQVNTPAYVRDNIHVSLLARAYASHVCEQLETGVPRHLNPRGYLETQGAFAERFATEMRPRLGLPCRLRLCTQTEFPEPQVRVNTDAVESQHPDWSQERAWDELAQYYTQIMGNPRKANQS